jgi:hypothetical protein
VAVDRSRRDAPRDLPVFPIMPPPARDLRRESSPSPPDGPPREPQSKKDIGRDGPQATKDGPLAKKDIAKDGPLAKKDIAKDGPLAKKDIAKDGPLAKKDIGQMKDGALVQKDKSFVKPDWLISILPPPIIAP